MYGVLYVDTDRAIAFDRVDLEVLSLFAEQAAAALESTSLLDNIQASFLALKAFRTGLLGVSAYASSARSAAESRTNSTTYLHPFSRASDDGPWITSGRAQKRLGA